MSSILRRQYLRIEQAVYKGGINVALTNVEKSDWYKEFRQEVEDALYEQIKEVATEDNVNNLTLFAKKESSLKDNIVSYLISIGTKVELFNFLIKAGEHGGQAALDKIGIVGTFVMKNQDLLDYFEDHTRLLIDSVDDYTKEWIAGQIQHGVDNFMTPDEIASTLIDEGLGISGVRADRIVLTETANAMSVVELEAAARNGVTEMIWRTSVDDRVCPICLPLEGEKVNIGQLFGGEYDAPPAHVSCRCFMEEVIPKDLPNNVWLGT